MELTYDPTVDAAAVRMRGPVVPGSIADTEELDRDRLVHRDAAGTVLKYELLHAKQLGVRLDDLEHCADLSRLFSEAGFRERDWSRSVESAIVRRTRRDRAAG